MEQIKQELSGDDCIFNEAGVCQVLLHDCDWCPEHDCKLTEEDQRNAQEVQEDL